MPEEEKPQCHINLMCTISYLKQISSSDSQRQNIQNSIIEKHLDLRLAAHML